MPGMSGNKNSHAPIRVLLFFFCRWYISVCVCVRELCMHSAHTDRRGEKSLQSGEDLWSGFEF